MHDGTAVHKWRRDFRALLGCGLGFLRLFDMPPLIEKCLTGSGLGQCKTLDFISCRRKRLVPSHTTVHTGPTRRFEKLR